MLVKRKKLPASKRKPHKKRREQLVMKALEQVLNDSNATAADRLKALTKMEKLFPDKAKKKSDGHGFQKKVEPSAPLIDQVLAEEKRRREAQPVLVPPVVELMIPEVSEPSYFQQQAQQIRLKAESQKAVEPPENLAMGSPQSEVLQEPNGITPSKSSTAAAFFKMFSQPSYEEQEQFPLSPGATRAILDSHIEAPPLTEGECWPDNDFAKPDLGFYRRG
jgi:hypothetical protein